MTDISFHILHTHLKIQEKEAKGKSITRGGLT